MVRTRSASLYFARLISNYAAIKVKLSPEVSQYMLRKEDFSFTLIKQECLRQYSLITCILFYFF